MKVSGFAIATAVATFVLLLVGGLVNPTGSSLACPDWPLCYGSAFPEMTGGILYEHSHRLVATFVGLMTVILGVLLIRARKQDAAYVKLAALVVIMVVVQGVLGGLTVLLRLPPQISTAHLALSMAFFVTLIYVAVRARRIEGAKPAPLAAPARRLMTAAALAVYAQIVLGGVVRHSGSAMACANDIPFCLGEIWPAGPLQQIHMAHRLVGVLVGILAIAAAVVAAPRLTGRLRSLARAIPVLVLAQIGLGVWTVLSLKHLHVVEMHLAVGVLLLAACALPVIATRPAQAATARRGVAPGEARRAPPVEGACPPPKTTSLRAFPRRLLEDERELELAESTR
jgi:heme A synthase